MGACCEDVLRFLPYPALANSECVAHLKQSHLSWTYTLAWLWLLTLSSRMSDEFWLAWHGKSANLNPEESISATLRQGSASFVGNLVEPSRIANDLRRRSRTRDPTQMLCSPVLTTWYDMLMRRERGSVRYIGLSSRDPRTHQTFVRA